MFFAVGTKLSLRQIFMQESVFEKYSGYKTNLLTLIAGILIGVLTNYIAFFIAPNYLGLALSVLGIFMIAYFFVSRYNSPTFSVWYELPENLTKDKLKPIIPGENVYDRLINRFLFVANLDVSWFWDTLFKKTNRTPYSISSKLSFLPSFLPLSPNKHLKRMTEISESLSLSKEERSMLEGAVRSKYQSSFAYLTGQIFEYESVTNRLLRGKGVFYFHEPPEAVIGCIVIPSASCVISRHYEEYHNSLHKKLAEILEKLVKDQEFKSILIGLSE